MSASGTRARTTLFPQRFPRTTEVGTSVQAPTNVAAPIPAAPPIEEHSA